MSSRDSAVARLNRAMSPSRVPRGSPPWADAHPEWPKVESTEKISALEGHLVRLEQDPNDSGLLGNISVCCIISRGPVVALAWAGRSILGRVAPGILTCGKAFKTFPDPQMHFPVIAKKFPVPLKKFPVPLRREFAQKLALYQ